MSSLIDEEARKREDEVARELGWWPASALAKCFGITEQHVRRLVRADYLPGPNEHGKYPALRCIRAYLKYCEEKAMDRAAGRRVVDEW